MSRILAALAALAVLAGCSAPTRGATVTVFAASSLATAFEDLADDAEVAFSFDGSSGLVDQIAGGAPADVFASADRRTMDAALDRGVVAGEPTLFATNHLVLVTPADNPAAVTGLDDSLAGAKLVACSPDVPCGAATQRLATAAGVALAPVSEETSVANVLGKVTSGEADAGLVYRTDAASAADLVQAIEVPGAAEDPNTYWIAAVDGGDTEAARDFIALVLGEEGQRVLQEHGFGAPSA